MARRVFYSFHYEADRDRVAMVRNIGAFEKSRIASDNDWEAIKRGGDPAIKAWIDAQMKGTSCCVVLIGSTTATRKWVLYEISTAWNEGKGVVGVHVYGLKNLKGLQSAKGQNPIELVTFERDRRPLSSVAKTYDPGGSDSKAVYARIEAGLAGWIEEAIQIRAGAG